MSTDLAPIGRRGIVNSARKLSQFAKPGYMWRDASAVFQQGMVATKGSDGELEVASSTSKILTGIFNCHKASTFKRPVVEESITFTGALSVISLAHPNVSKVVVNKVSDGSAYTVTTHYTVQAAAGTITHVGTIGNTETVNVSYLYEDPDLAALDQTQKSRKASILADGEIALKIYDTSKIMTDSGGYDENVKVTCDDDGLVTTGGSIQLGYVTKPPTSGDPELHIMLDIVSTF